MRTFLIAALSLMLCVPAIPAAAGSPRHAAPQVGGFHGPSVGHTVNTVAQALKAKDDTRCVLEGHIIASGPKHKKYLFQDHTGKITVEIENKVFAGRTVTPQNRVRLHGEVDTEMLREPEVEVDMLEILK